MAGRHQHVRVDEDAEHAEAFVELDESHAAHVGGEIVNPVAAIAGLNVGILLLEIQGVVVGIRESLIPLPLRFLVHRADFVPPFEQQTGSAMNGTKFRHPDL